MRAVDKVEAKKLYSAFISVADKDGCVDRAGFQQALRKLEDDGLKKITDIPFVDRLFEIFDVNGDAKVDMKEFITGLAMLCKGSNEEKIELTFQAYDLDNSGFITKDEMVEMFRSTYEAALNCLRVSHGSKGLDSEFLQDFVAKFKSMITAWITSMWDTWDANKDGKLSLEEFRQYVSSEPYVAATLNGFRAEVPMSYK